MHMQHSTIIFLYKHLKETTVRIRKVDIHKSSINQIEAELEIISINSACSYLLTLDNQ